MAEHDEQVELFRLIALYEPRYPELGLCFAIPNGGKRYVTTAVRLQREGVKAGIPDLFLPVMRYGKAESEMLGGLFIEMKYGKNRAQKSQLEWHDKLRKQSYRVEVCYGWQEAWDAICRYLDIEV